MIDARSLPRRWGVVDATHDQSSQVHILLGYYGEASMAGLNRRPGTPEVANGELFPA
jgi:hypothetical protein